MMFRFLFATALLLAPLAPAQSAPRGEGAYRSGDYPRAAARLGPAAERGDARAQGYLGFMYQYGRGVPQNYVLAIYWYRRGAEQGNPVAQHLLGLMYDKGLGVPTDHVAAHVWLSLAAARTKGPEHEDNVRLRDAVANKMSRGQLADAQYLASLWLPKRELAVPVPVPALALPVPVPVPAPVPVPVR
ncbi:MAG: sel1 repeat family protein [Alphaproteobacteria bacterium]|nr:MAG: sel1 repeat family protein [Alphaproteobacteria bacterium]